jgi:hypothetical protein
MKIVVQTTKRNRPFPNGSFVSFFVIPADVGVGLKPTPTALIIIPSQISPFSRLF